MQIFGLQGIRTKYCQHRFTLAACAAPCLICESDISDKRFFVFGAITGFGGASAAGVSTGVGAAVNLFGVEPGFSFLEVR